MSLPDLPKRKQILCNGPCGKSFYYLSKDGYCIRCFNVAPKPSSEERPCDRCGKYTDSPISRMCEQCYEEYPEFVSDLPFCSKCHREHDDLSCDNTSLPRTGICPSCNQKFIEEILENHSGFCERCSC